MTDGIHFDTECLGIPTLGVEMLDSLLVRPYYGYIRDCDGYQPSAGKTSPFRANLNSKTRVPAKVGKSGWNHGQRCSSRHADSVRGFFLITNFKILVLLEIHGRSVDEQDK